MFLLVNQAYFLGSFLIAICADVMSTGIVGSSLRAVVSGVTVSIMEVRPYRVLVRVVLPLLVASCAGVVFMTITANIITAVSTGSSFYAKCAEYLSSDISAGTA